MKQILLRKKAKYSDPATLTIKCNVFTAEELLPLLKQLKYMGQIGASRTIKIEDYDGDNTFGIDGDGPSMIYEIRQDGELVKSKSAVEHLKKEGLHKEGHKMEVDPKELARGINIEMEHTSSKAVAREIALDHLHEDEKYYTHLSKV